MEIPISRIIKYVIYRICVVVYNGFKNLEIGNNVYIRTSCCVYKNFYEF